MTDPNRGSRPSLPPTLVRLVERSCDRFEAAWREGKRPRIEDETLAVPEPGRSELLRELLVLELAYRRRAGEGPGPREYRERFRGYERVVDEAFGLPAPDARQSGPAGEPTSAAGGFNWLAGETTCTDEPGRGDREETSSRALGRPGSHPMHAEAADLTDPGPGREAALARAGSDPPLQMGPPVSGPKTYEVLGEIARGGMGAVLKAHDPELGRDLALKVLLETHRDNGELVRRSLAEARINGRLQHPGIVPIYDLGTLADRRPFFAMKLIQGRILAALLGERSDPGRDLPRFEGIFSQVCQTVAYAHAARVIHRDLKPANIMVGGFGEVQVMDWGLAKVLSRSDRGDETAGAVPGASVPTIPRDRDDDPTTLGVMGTPGYMPPEQARGEVERLDERADVFALGAILCEILTGRPAYDGRSSAEVLSRARRADLADAHDRLEGCDADPELIGLARRCLAPEPHDRPRHAGVVADAVTAYLTGVQERLRAAEPARVEAQTRASEERKRRRLTVALAGAILVVCGITGFGVLEYQSRRRQETARFEVAIARVAQLCEAARAAWSERSDAAPWRPAEEAAGVALSLLTPRLPRSRREELRRLTDTLNAEARMARDDAALLEALEAARATASDREFDAPGAFRRAFEDHGLPASADATDPERGALVARLRRSRGAVAVRFASLLDSWALSLRRSPAEQDQAARLTGVAQAIDPDRWREGLRGALTMPDRSDRKKALLRLASEPDAGDQPPPTLTLLASALRTVGESPAAVGLLGRARFRHPSDPWIHQELGLALRGMRPPRDGDALRALTAATTLRPELGYELARALHDTGRTVEAIAVLEDVLPRTPNVWYQTRLGEMQAERGLKAAAAESFRRAVAAGRDRVARHPRDAAAHYRLGIALRDSGDLHGAETACREAIRLDPSLAPAYSNLGAALRRLGDKSGAVAAHREALRLDPELAAAHLNLGLALFDSRDLPGAAAACRKAIDLSPGWATAHSYLGMVLQASGDLPGAIAACREAIRLKPDEISAHINLASVLFVSRDLPGAIAASREAIRLRPDYAMAYINLGVALEASNDLPGAIAASREAIRLQPGSALAHSNLGAELRQAGDLAGAVAAGREAVRLQPQWAKAHLNLGESLEAAGDLRGAIEAWREVTRLQPGRGELHAILARLLQQSGDLPGVAAAYREAIRVQPRLASHHYNLGCVLQESGDLSGAVAAYREAIRQRPEYARAYCNLGNALRSLGQLEEALTALERGHELGSHEPGWPFPSAAWVDQCRRLIERKRGHRTAPPKGDSHPAHPPANELPANPFNR